MHTDALDLIAQHLSVPAAAKARCVNSKWKTAVDSTDAEPVGSAILQKEWGAFKLKEAACWTPSHLRDCDQRSPGWSAIPVLAEERERV